MSSAIRDWWELMILAARTPAFFVPSIATQPTGTPGGICTAGSRGPGRRGVVDHLGPDLKAAAEIDLDYCPVGTARFVLGVTEQSTCGVVVVKRLADRLVYLPQRAGPVGEEGRLAG